MALTISVAQTDQDLNSINTLLNAKTPVTGSGATVTYGAKTLTDTAGAFLSLPATIVGMTATVGAKVGTIASRTATVITLTANWAGGAPAAQSAYSIAPGFSIRDELIADYGAVIPLTLAFWHPFLADPDTYILMGRDALNQLRGAGMWHLEGDRWMVKIIGIDKSLTVQQRVDGLHDVFQGNSARVPASTKFGGVCKVGGRIDQFLGSRLPAANRSLLDGQAVYRCTGAEAAQYL